MRKPMTTVERHLTCPSTRQRMLSPDVLQEWMPSLRLVDEHPAPDTVAYVRNPIRYMNN
jgi:hypothetical protein